ncbi:hypothetical protein APHACPA_1105 [Rickettsia amblyommatis str. Ac/Pa]|uniref:Uncharacterized protein n=1 Tax=Rickettsia amblyommatis str. Ac/Pa TaxID=1359164 RepID=A0A0F3N204_RICAM|nr:hypothetical protein APHACPA_1105 [Rickettsia amblyommatis str. Ac/Pa]
MSYTAVALMSFPQKRESSSIVIPRLDRRTSKHSLLHKIPWSSHGMTIVKYNFFKLNEYTCIHTKHIF